MKSLLLIAALLGPADFQQAMLTLCGASCVEELSDDEVQRYHDFVLHPLNLNLAGESRLRSSGLFSPFQLASLLEYRRESGDILSFAELGLVDGFSPALAEALSFFVRLDSSSPPGSRRSSDLRGGITLRGATEEFQKYAGSLRCEASLGETAELKWTSRTTYSKPEIGLGTVSAAIYGRGHLGKVVAGCFNARFGQGLVSWSGFSLSGYSSAASFYRNPSGISPTGAAGAELCGAGADWRLGRYTLSTAWDMRGNGGIVNLSRLGRHSTLGMTATMSAASLDWRVSLPGTSLFGETACSYAGEFSALAGALWVPQYGRKFTMQARWFDRSINKYSGVALGMDTPSCVLTADMALRRDKSQSQHKLLLLLRRDFAGQDSLAIRPSLRFAARLRPADTSPLRSDVRADLSLQRGEWILAGRFNALWCKAFACLGYLEGAYSAEKFQLWLRGGLFRADNWDDRIYAYERDAPGSFNVPAYYGRGCNASLYLVWHLSRRHSLWLRAETVDYPWNPAPKEGRTRLSLQYRWKL